MVNYFQVKCEAMEDFYLEINDGTLKNLGFTIPQIVEKMEYEIQNEDELFKLIFYTTLIARVAIHERESLKLFKNDIEMIKKMISKKELLQQLSEKELEDLKDQLEYFL